jgi:hypothetical protein
VTARRKFEWRIVLCLNWGERNPARDHVVRVEGRNGEVRVPVCTHIMGVYTYP